MTTFTLTYKVEVECPFNEEIFGPINEDQSIDLVNYLVLNEMKTILKRNGYKVNISKMDQII